MADNYLRIAQHVLETRARPLTAQQILRDAQRHGLVPAHLSGQTMEKTLQARIAEDIFEKRAASVFYRTKLGTYFLRSLSDDATLPPDTRTEFGRPRTPRVPHHRLLYYRLNRLPDAPILKSGRYALKESKTEYRSIAEADAALDLYAVTTSTFVFWNGNVLLHRRGRYSSFFQPHNKLSAGFLRHVDEYDVDLFVDDPTGAEMSARREYARVVGGHISLDVTEPRFTATYFEPSSRRIIFAVIFTISGNSEYTGSLPRLLDSPQLHWALRTNVEVTALDPISHALLPSTSTV